MEPIKKIFRPIVRQTAPWMFDIYHHLRGMTAATIYGFPSAKMRVIGVTGTNGKTTVCNMLAHILEANGERVGLATTVNIWTGNRKWINETKMTTLSPFALQGLLRKMVNHKCTYAIVETTSHALDQHRTWGIFYDVAVFTNLTHDHLDYHKTLEQYQTAKGLLFKNLADSLRKPNLPKTAIINISDPAGEYFDQFITDQKFYFAIDDINTPATPDKTLWATDVKEDRDATHFILHTPNGSADITLHLPGKFNVYNALAAASAAHALGIPLIKIQQGLDSLWQVPGRMEYVPNTKGIDIIIDYAHTPDGFQKVFEALRPIVSGKIIAVFGASGERDKTKRPILGQIASHFADEIILTEEDPASEDPFEIVKEIGVGLDPNKFQADKNLHIIIDRKEAIKKALSIAVTGDLVLCLSMGAQTVMAKGGSKVPYSERATIEDALRAMS
ncbi:MAG: UDP-N-acetylmuramoyl-L-alanyl-D-glutamate--2,6-diaminopimelate ligase [Patescibacteria group bacterium]|jgi:UDP-N-acetylmuramoyl-L-alanyl-D-glutamate--2,6-diaminopimelate ligase